ncbi:bifunctional phosphoribosyl-AMP cyclohydrolase/phosphoribosyl-ATP diphosphatase HisIE [Caldalkalibacillus salinus]|uniref:bifunctional phosphoribosyl-AMP cyclohydrolase/phosphoribosyl-ATP diphosphatase HisIE n=1 Tax=Caldalkalibacillus salinus TaxID=2803787 RepID=UPI001924D474|nr:bifunctional phosphoribosyl-AMP cyclohydrolase/phosphoribosyl-ATP diphosphatase HisIE [Caldalkalibacillus salinus]
MANQITSIEDITFDEQGLVPAIVQDRQSKAVLMMAYMNRTSLQKTIETKQTWFYSRSRQSLWHKGETSGHTQQVHEIRYDCDGDTLLVMVDPAGPACHEGTFSCFARTIDVDTSAEQNAGTDSLYDYTILSELIQTIAQREVERPEGAYTTYLFDKGVDKILKKVGEEASEVIIAAKNRDPEELRNESADLLYHLIVLWKEQNLGLDQVLEILEQRHRK